jgi:hypothetical protein
MRDLRFKRNAQIGLKMRQHKRKCPKIGFTGQRVANNRVRSLHGLAFHVWANTAPPKYTIASLSNSPHVVPAHIMVVSVLRKDQKVGYFKQTGTQKDHKDVWPLACPALTVAFCTFDSCFSTALRPDYFQHLLHTP